jgi:hypothetical protein
MSKRHLWKGLSKTGPISDLDTQSELGKISSAWRQAKAFGERENADYYADILINRVTPSLVWQRLSALDAETAGAIIRLFGNNFADARTRARVFEVCDFIYVDDGDEDRLAEHESI